MPLTRRVKISVYPPPNSVTARPVQAELTLAELMSSLTEPPCEVASKLDAAAWSPIAYSGTHRRAVEAVSVCALVYDLDDPEAIDWEELDELLAPDDWLYVIHKTFTDGCARLVLPLSEDCAPSDYAALREAVASKLQLVHDPACSDLARLFFVPSQPVGAGRTAGTSGGTNPIAPYDIVPRSLQTPETQPSAPLAIPEPKAFNMGALQEEVKALKNFARREQLQSLLDGTLRIPPSQRESILHPLMGSLSHLRHAPPEEVAEALLRRVLSVRDGASTMLESWVEDALDSFQRGAARKALLDREAAEVESFFRQASDGDAWKSKLRLKHDSKGAVAGTKNSEANLLLILANDPEFRNRIRWNVLKNKIETPDGFLSKQPPESLDVPLAAWLQSSVYHCDTSAALAGSCLAHTALANPFDPVRQFLNALPEWDGVPRCDGLLLDYANAEGNPDWIRVVTRKFFIAAVARVMEPGCQVDSTLVLQGAQGGGKTSFVRVMGAGYHVETSLDLHNKDAVMTAAQNWLVELGELASLRKADVESVRNFLTRKEDQIRLPYGRTVQTMPRRCIFIGTTNSRQPLTDPEGSRRFWVVSVGRVDTVGLARIRDQAWAEALHLYKTGSQWWLTQDESVTAANEASVYEVEDIVKTEILFWLDSTKNRPGSLTAGEVASKILQRPLGTVSTQEVVAINRSMKNLGWEPCRKRVAGVQVRAFKVPAKESENEQEHS